MKIDQYQNTMSYQKIKLLLIKLNHRLGLKGFPSVEVCKTIVIRTNGGNLSFEVKPEYEPIKKIYFDEAIKQILRQLIMQEYIEVNR